MSMASRAILSTFFKEQWTQNHPQYLSGLSRALFPTTFLEIAVYTSNVVPAERLTGRVWCSKCQSSLLNIFSTLVSVGSSPHSYLFTSATVRIYVHIPPKGGLRNDDGNGYVNSRCLKLYRAYSVSFNSSNVGIKCINVQEKKKKSCCLLFLSSTKREVRLFHVVVVQRQQKNVQKRDARAKLFCLSKPVAFLPAFSSLSSSSLRRLPKV